MILVTVLFFVPQFRAFISVSNTTRSLPAVMHLAVLPFDTINNSPEEKSFSNGLAHLVAINLMRMEHDAEEMWIIPVREVLSRGVISASEAKESFGVNLAVSGTIVNTPEALQIWLDVTDAQTLRVIDSDVIELEEMDPLIVQEQVMAKLARMLELRVPGDENVMLAGLTDDPEAYKLYVRSQGLIQEYMIEENVDEAIKLLEQAIERDSTFALAYAAAGFAYARKYYFTKDIDLFDLARARSEKSLELNDELVEVWTTLLLIKDRLERVNPNDPELLWSATEIHGKLRQVGTARIYFQRYLDLDRQDTYSLYRIFMGYELINDRDSALVYLERALEKGYAYAGGSWGPWFEDVWEDPRGQTILARY